MSEINEIIARHDSKLIEGEYINGQSKIKIRCKSGHTFDKKARDIRSGSWCSHCGKYKSEKKCRELIEELTGHSFPKTKMTEFVVPETGGNVELDGYCEDLALAFEFQGQQHYEYNTFFFKSEEDFEAQQYRDELKRQYCDDFGVLLIEIPYTDYTDQYKYNRIVSFLDDNKIAYTPIEDYELD